MSLNVAETIVALNNVDGFWQHYANLPILQRVIAIRNATGVSLATARATQTEIDGRAI